MNQFSIGFPTFWRDYNRLGHPTATEHTMYSTTDKLWKFAAEKRKLTDKGEDGTPWEEGFSPYKFKDEESKGSAQSIHVEHWSDYKDYYVDWIYDPATNTYSRKNGEVAHVDKNTNKQLSAKNIVVLYMVESSANDGYENNAHLLYRTKGSGKALVFMDGKQTKATWSKKDRTDKTVITDEAGEEIKFNRGKIWFHILPLDGILKVK